MSHTPGPWRAFKDRLNPWWAVHAERRSVADIGTEVTVWNDPKYPAAVEANARLIAAAPDLLALARQCARECSGCDGTGEVEVRNSDGEPAGEAPCEDCADIRAVIARAEGRS